MPWMGFCGGYIIFGNLWKGYINLKAIHFRSEQATNNQKLSFFIFTERPRSKKKENNLTDPNKHKGRAEERKRGRMQALVRKGGGKKESPHQDGCRSH